MSNIDWIIITGASSGIGEALARRLASNGTLRLLLVARRANELTKIAQQLNSTGGSFVEVMTADVSDSDAIERLSAWLRAGNRVRVLVNSAGIGRFSPVSLMQRRDLEEVVSTNLIGLFLFSQPVISQMISWSGSKTIVNVSSDCESVGFSDASAYGATKGGVYAISKSWQSELRQYGIRVCNIAPGRVDTHFNNKAPGMRLGALKADDVASVIEFVIACPPNLEVRQIEIDSMQR